VPRIKTSGLSICPSNWYSHCHYEKGGLHPCVPMHRELKPKTPQSILKQANVTIEELADNL
jgi:hypothetical protein